MQGAAHGEAAAVATYRYIPLHAVTCRSPAIGTPRQVRDGVRVAREAPHHLVRHGIDHANAQVVTARRDEHGVALVAQQRNRRAKLHFLLQRDVARRPATQRAIGSSRVDREPPGLGLPLQRVPLQRVPLQRGGCRYSGAGTVQRGGYREGRVPLQRGGCRYSGAGTVTAGRVPLQRGGCRYSGAASARMWYTTCSPRTAPACRYVPLHTNLQPSHRPCMPFRTVTHQPAALAPPLCAVTYRYKPAVLAPPLRAGRPSTPHRGARPTAGCTCRWSRSLNQLAQNGRNWRRSRR